MTPTASSKATRKPPAREKELLDRQAETDLEARNVWPSAGDNVSHLIETRSQLIETRQWVIALQQRNFDLERRVRHLERMVLGENSGS